MVSEKIARREKSEEKKVIVNGKDLSAFKLIFLFVCGFFFILLSVTYSEEGLFLEKITTYEKFLFSSSLFFVSVLICIKETVDGISDLSRMRATKSAVLILSEIPVLLWAVFSSVRMGITGENRLSIAPFLFSDINFVLYALSEIIDFKARSKTASGVYGGYDDADNTLFRSLLGTMLLVPSLIFTFSFISLGNAERGVFYMLCYSVYSLPMLPILTKSLISYAALKTLNRSGITPNTVSSIGKLSKLPQNVSLYGRKSSCRIAFECNGISVCIGERTKDGIADVYMEKGKSGFSNGKSIALIAIQYQKILPAFAAILSFLSGIVFPFFVFNNYF